MKDTKAVSEKRIMRSRRWITYRWFRHTRAAGKSNVPPKWECDCGHAWEWHTEKFDVPQIGCHHHCGCTKDAHQAAQLSNQYEEWPNNRVWHLSGEILVDVILRDGTRHYSRRASDLVWFNQPGSKCSADIVWWRFSTDG